MPHPHHGSSPAARGPGPATATSHGPALKITFDPANTVFFITADARMPTIKVSCTVQGAPAAASASTAAGTTAAAVQTYEWDVALVLHPAGVPHAVGRTTQHPPIHASTNVPQFSIPFTRVRGGTLTVTVATSVGGHRINGKATAEIIGTNPSSTLIRAEGVSDLQMKLMMLESGLNQFLPGHVKRGYPYFSRDGKGGVGLGQITTPRPTEDQIWDWKANVKAAMALWENRRTNDAARLLRKYASGADFRKLVDAYNRVRTTAPAAAGAQSHTVANAVIGHAAAAAAPLKPLTITLPPLTDEMIDNETLRLYNGAPFVQEYVAEIDRLGILVVDVNADGLHGTARWHQVTGAERRLVYTTNGKPAELGDPDYVEHVRSEVVI